MKRGARIQEMHHILVCLLLSLTTTGSLKTQCFTETCSVLNPIQSCYRFVKEWNIHENICVVWFYVNHV